MRDPNQKVSVLKDGRVHVETVNKEPSMTQQQFKDECDINKIMDKYQKTGEFTHLTAKQGRYGDFSNIQDYQEMLDTVRYAQEAFALLPANLRSRFRNDPGELIGFLQDPNNKDEAITLGLIDKPLEVHPPATQTTPSATTPLTKTNKKSAPITKNDDSNDET